MTGPTDGADPTDDESTDPPGTAMRVGYAVAYFLLLGFSVGGAVGAVTDALLLSPALGATSALGTLATAVVAGVLSGIRQPPSTARVLAFSVTAVALQFGLGTLLVRSAGEVQGSVYLATDVGLTWLAALLFAYALVVGVDWSGPRGRLRAHLRGERD
jgi:Kef-type K+ transport system membrane component KefB